jgi:hypothetical protein
MTPPIHIKIVEAARELLKANGYFVDNLWHVQDIKFIAEQYQLPELTDSEAMEVFAIANEQFDGEQGLSWPLLEKAVFLFMKRKALFKDMCSSGTSEHEC